MADIGEGLGSLLGGVVGGIAAGPDRGHQQALIDEAIAAIQGVKAPSDLAKQIYFQQYQNAGQLTPAQEQAILSGPSAEAQVKANPELVKAQMQALNTLKGITQTGMTSADKARLNQIQQQLQTQAEGQRQAIMQNYAQRGLAGSGNELLAQLTNAQNAANQANQGGLNVAANAQQNALSALGQYGGLSGQMNQQQFGQQAQTAQAADLMNRFNVQNQLAQQQRNVGTQNAAQQYNLANKQNLMGQNTNLYNQGLLLQRQGEQQQFEDALQKAQSLSGAQFKGAGQYGDLANQIAQQWTNTGKGIGGLAGQAFTGGASSVPMFGGGSAAQGGMSQGAYDTFANYTKGMGYASGGEVGYSGGGSTGGFDGLTDEQRAILMADRSFHDGGYMTPNVPYSFGGHVPREEDRYVRTYGNGFDAPNNYSQGGLTGPGKDVRAMDVDPRQIIKGMKEEREHSSNPQVAKQIALDHLAEHPQYYMHGGACYSMGGETFLTPALSKALMKHGGHVPGEAKVPGDSYANDTVHARLSAGEIVIPRSITQSPRAGELAKHFVEGELEKHRK